MREYAAPITVSDYSRFGTIVRSMATDHPARVVRYSRNLRAMRDYARVSPVACVITRKGEIPGSGLLTVVYSDGCLSQANFNSHAIMLDFVRNRRSWRAAEFRHQAGNMGYLSKPGIIAGV